MHNAGNRKDKPFLDLSCADLSDSEQYEQIFGERGCVSLIPGGTLFIQDIEALTIPNQYRLYRLIRFKSVFGNEIGELRNADIRIVVSTVKPLYELLKEGIIREDLYYLLTGMELRVPSLRERPEIH